jgi:hypothetical protein
MYFQSENETAARKVKRHAKERPSLTPHSRDRVSEDSVAVSTVWTKEVDSFLDDIITPFLWPSLQQPVEDVGLSYFMSSYVPGSHFEYLPSVYNNADMSSPLPAVLHAASLASLAQENNDSSLMELARKSYTKGLTMINTALANPTTAIADSTLASVLLLSLFEALVWDGIYTAINWTAHTLGAMAVIKLRGESQFRTDVGRRMFMQVGNNIRVSCIQRLVECPPELLELLTVAQPYYGDFNPKFLIAGLTTELTELLARGRRAQGRTSPLEYVRATQLLDAKFLQAMQTLPPGWQYQQIQTQSQEESGAGFQSIAPHYPSHHVAQFWNSYRMIRVLLNEIICSVSQEVIDRALIPPTELLQAQQDALNNVAEMADDICMTVQRFIPASFSAYGSNTPPESLNMNMNMNLPSRACAASLLWPLSIVRSANSVPKATAQYAADRLRELGIGLKIRQAVKVSGISHELDALRDG